MKVNREELVKILKVARIGTTPKELIEQSHSFVFSEGEILTFNDEIMVKGPCPLDFTTAVPADDFEGILARIPDEEIDISLHGNEVLIKGRRKRAGISCFQDILLPFNAVPAPSKWSKLKKDVEGVLQQAARTCGKDLTQILSTLVYVTPDRIEASDNFRLFRQEITTGFPKEVLLPASSIGTLGSLSLRKVSIGKGWAHFRTKADQIISIRCYHGKYHAKKEMDSVLELKEGKKITLPKNLGKIISRTEIMSGSGYDSRIHMAIAGGILKVTSRKDSGWYREKKKIDYDGEDISFYINPDFLVEVLQKTRTVRIAEGKMKIAAKGMQFVVSLEWKG